MHSPKSVPWTSSTSKLGMCCLKTMSCIGNNRAVILSRFNSCLIRSSHSPVVSVVENSQNVARVSRQSGRWSVCTEVAPRSTGCWGLKSKRRDSGSCGAGVRTFASSARGSARGSGRGSDEGAEDVSKILERGLFTEASKAVEEQLKKPEICTADELHYVAVPGTTWRLALWRYLPPPNAPKRNHPLLMLSGIGTNAIGFDLDPSVSMARHMAGAGFDTWILEVRGSGLSKSEGELAKEGKEETETSDGALVENKQTPETGTVDVPEKAPSEHTSADSNSDELPTVRKEDGLQTGNGAVADNKRKRETDSSTEALRESTNGEGTVSDRDEGMKFSLAGTGSDLRKRLAQLLEDGQYAVSPRVTNLQERLSNTVDEFQKFVDILAKYDWDFDDYLNEDVPTAMEYIRNQARPADGKILSVGHSMGGIVLYALLSTRGNEAGLAGAVTLASGLDYQCSNTSLKLLLPLTDPAQALNVPLVPLGVLMTAVHPLVVRAPYALAWLGYNVSAKNMMRKELFSKLVLNNFGTIPVKLLLHLNSVFRPGGLTNRDGSIKYKENIGNITVPVLAVAGDQDLICPPVAVVDTVNSFNKETITYKCFGGESDRHFGHYDIVCSPGAKEEVFPYVEKFLVQHDEVKMEDKVKVGVET